MSFCHNLSDQSNTPSINNKSHHSVTFIMNPDFPGQVLGKIDWNLSFLEIL